MGVENIKNQQDSQIIESKTESTYHAAESWACADINTWLKGQTLKNIVVSCHVHKVLHNGARCYLVCVLFPRYFQWYFYLMLLITGVVYDVLFVVLGPTFLTNFLSLFKFNGYYFSLEFNWWEWYRRVSQMWALLSVCREIAVGYNKLPLVLYDFEQKVIYLIYAQYTCIVVFWHNRNISWMTP